ncbi:MAG: hypothetical protein IPG02_05460 [Ignavibacteria bacterium]|nr:hypothetical protein [Ignavibacteria bacterium]
MAHRDTFGFVNGSGSMIGTLAEALAAALTMNTGGWLPAPAANRVRAQNYCVDC